MDERIVEPDGATGVDETHNVDNADTEIPNVTAQEHDADRTVSRTDMSEDNGITTGRHQRVP